MEIKNPPAFRRIFCDPAGTRTQGPYIKSVLLYQLSYEINLSLFGSAKIQVATYHTKTFSNSYSQYLQVIVD